MDGVSATMYTKLRTYWRRKGYQRINDSSRRRGNTIELGGTTRRRRFWRIKIKPKLKLFKTSSPKKFLVWLRDAYVKMMLGFANSRVVGPGYGDHPGVTGFGRGPIKEYDEKMIIQIYKSILAQGQIVPGDAARFASVSRLTAIVE
ncbi:uncharacterized protein [Euphorbia lathyris]|uniref:uncharacterized protein n=1 Tax=Euphorbia lathyris TaxID=212925 RepID=UPI003313BA3E